MGNNLAVGRAGVLSANTVAVALSSLALLVGLTGSLFLGKTAYSLFESYQSAPTSIDSSSLAWMNDIHLDVQKSRLPSDSELLVGPPLPAGSVAEEQLPIASMQLVPAAQSVAIHRPHRVRHHEKQRLIRLVTSSAAPVTVAQAAPVTESVDSEMETMRRLHTSWSQRFFLAMAPKPSVSTQTLVAQSEDLPPPPEETAAAAVSSQWHPIHRKQNIRKSNPAASIDQIIDQDLAKEKLPLAAQDVPTDEPTSNFHIISRKTPSLSALNGSLNDKVLVTQAAPAPETAMVATGAANRTARRTDELTARPEELDSMDNGAAASTEFASKAAKLWAEYSKTDSESASAGGIIVANQRVSRHVATQSVVPPAPPVSTQPRPQATGTSIAPVSTHTAAALVSTAPATMVASSQVTPTHSATSAPNATPSMIEAFDWSTPITQGAYSQFTQEETGTHFVGWGKAEAADHWATYARGTVTTVPLISNNSAKLLAAIAGTTLQSETSIVFGKLPSGWNVRISGRAERPVVLNFQNQAITPENNAGDRYFAFLNVAPGAHWVYLADSNGIEEGAVVVAAMGRASTYVDLSNISHVAVSGVVMDGSSDAPRPLANVTVRILGRSSASTQSDSHGRFQFSDILAVADHPVLIETDSMDGYTHRYQLRKDQLSSATLYRLDPSAVEEWLGQLEGSISSESGLVVAALPSLVTGTNEVAHLQPAVQSLDTSGTLFPEVYTVDDTGQLEVHAPLSEHANRFVSVQIPEGPALVSAVDASGQPTWSEIVVASPRVINLIGPN